MKKFIYELDGHYYIVEANSMVEAMVAVSSNGGVVIGDYTSFAHMFGD